MSENKRVLQFPIGETEQLIEIIEGLTEIKIDMDVESTPSSIKISLYGSEGKIDEAEGKIRSLIEDSKVS